MKELKPEFKEMIAGMSRLKGGEIFDRLVTSLSGTEAVVGVRPNRRKGASVAADHAVGWGTGSERVIGGPRPQFTFDPALHQGLYYVQDPSSMAVGSVIKALTADNSPVVFIDACAAPGGKTTAAIDALPDRSVVIANEWDRRRAEILRENVIKWGYPAVAVSRGDTARFRKLPDLADIIAVDAPCSGEGMMRKDDDAVAQWSPRLVDECTALQREILENMWTALRPGGCMIYSTCTFNTSENEANVRWMIDRFGAENPPLPLPPCDAISGPVGDFGVNAARFIPGIAEGEGLFMALLRKPDGIDAATDRRPPADSIRRNKRAAKADRPAATASSALRHWLSGDFVIETAGDSVTAVPDYAAAIIGRAAESLDLIVKGVDIATVKGRDYIPSQALALSTALSREAFPEVEVDYPTAVAVLRGEAVTLGDGAPRGIVLLTYRQRPLAFVKNLGNRANNPYPKAWAVKSTHIPPEPPSVIT